MQRGCRVPVALYCTHSSKCSNGSVSRLWRFWRCSEALSVEGRSGPATLHVIVSYCFGNCWPLLNAVWVEICLDCFRLPSICSALNPPTHFVYRFVHNYIVSDVSCNYSWDSHGLSCYFPTIQLFDRRICGSKRRDWQLKGFSLRPHHCDHKRQDMAK